MKRLPLILAYIIIICMSLIGIIPTLFLWFLGCHKPVRTLDKAFQEIINKSRES